MKALLAILALLMIGPLRRPYLRHARFTLPATVGALAGLGIGAVLAVRSSIPPAHLLVLCLLMSLALAVGGGEAGKEWCDRVFGPRRDDHDRP